MDILNTLSHDLNKFKNYLTGHKKNAPMAGIYDSQTPEGLGANWGREVSKEADDNSLFTSGIQEIQYKFYDEDGNWSKDSSLAYSTETMKNLDSNSDGKLTIDDKYWEDQTRYSDFDKESIFNIFDLNNDNQVDAAEDTAFALYQDKNNDGKVNFDEALNGLKNAVSDPNAKADMQKLYEENNLGEQMKQFKMPKTTLAQTSEDIKNAMKE